MLKLKVISLKNGINKIDFEKQPKFMFY